ncbi:unnamed protein product, partial [Mesorhabditis spiculigera]
MQCLFSIFDDGEDIRTIEVIYENAEDPCILLYSDVLKYAILYFKQIVGSLTNYEKSSSASPSQIWKTVVDIRKINSAAALDGYVFPRNSEWTYCNEQSKISMSADFEVEIRNALDPDSAEIVVLERGPNSGAQQKIVGSDADGKITACYAEGSTFVTLYRGSETETRAFDLISDKNLGYCCDLAIADQSVLILTLQKLYCIRPDGSVISTQLRAHDLCKRDIAPAHRRLRVLSCVDLASKKHFTEIYAVVDDVIYIYQLAEDASELRFVTQRNPGVGSITAWTEWTDEEPIFYVAGPLGIVSMDGGDRRHRIFRSQYTMYCGPHSVYTAARYERAYAFYESPPERPTVEPGPYKSIICVNLERKAFILAREDGLLAYALLGDIGNPKGPQLELVVPRTAWGFQPGSAGVPVFTIPYIFDADENGARDAFLKMHIFVECARVGCELHMQFRYLSPAKKLEKFTGALPLGPNGEKILPKPELVKSAYMLVSNRSFVILAFTSLIVYEKSKDQFSVISVDSFVADRSEDEYTPKYRSRKIVDMHFCKDRRELLVLMENARIVCFQWVTWKDQFKLHEIRWMSLPGMQIARSLHLNRQNGFDDPIVFGFCMRNDNARFNRFALTPVAYDIKAKSLVMEWGQDALHMLDLPRDHYSVDISDSLGILIDFEEPTAKKGLRIHLGKERVGCVLPPLIPHDIRKMVAAPVDELGLSLIAAIGHGVTLMIYQPETETLIKVNEHFPRDNCNDVGFGKVNKVKIKKVVCLRVLLFVATDSEIEVLQVIVKGDSEFDWPGWSNRSRETIRPEAPIAHRFGFWVGSRVRQIYIPDQEGPENECVIYFILDATPDSTTIKVGMVIFYSESITTLPKWRPFPVATCKDIFMPYQQFKMTSKTTTSGISSLDIYYRPFGASNRSKFKMATWDLKSPEIVFNKEVEAFESFEYDSKLLSVKRQGDHFTFNSRQVDSTNKDLNKPSKGPTYFLHQDAEKYGWLAAKKYNGQPNFFVDKQLTARAKRYGLRKWLPILRNHALVYSDRYFQIVPVSMPLNILQRLVPKRLRNKMASLKRAASSTLFPTALSTKQEPLEPDDFTESDTEPEDVESSSVETESIPDHYHKMARAAALYAEHEPHAGNKPCRIKYTKPLAVRRLRCTRTRASRNWSRLFSRNAGESSSYEEVCDLTTSHT